MHESGRGLIGCDPGSGAIAVFTNGYIDGIVNCVLNDGIVNVTRKLKWTSHKAQQYSN